MTIFKFPRDSRWRDDPNVRLGHMLLYNCSWCEYERKCRPVTLHPGQALEPVEGELHNWGPPDTKRRFYICVECMGDFKPKYPTQADVKLYEEAEASMARLKARMAEDEKAQAKAKFPPITYGSNTTTLRLTPEQHEAILRMAPIQWKPVNPTGRLGRPA